MLSDAELVAVMRQRAGLMKARAEALRIRSKKVSRSHAQEMQRIARGLDSRAFFVRQAASSIETLEAFDHV